MGRGRGLFARVFAAVLALAFAVSVWAVGGASHAYAEGTSFTIPGLNDVCYDDARGLLYVVSGSAIGRYDVAANKWLTPLFVGKLGCGLVGIDLSPDGRTIAVADNFNTIYGVDDGSTDHVWFVDAETGADHYVKFAPGWAGREAGTWAVQFGADGKALVTAGYPGSGWTPLRVVDPTTGVVTQPVGLTQYCDLSASGDKSTITFAEENISDGRWGTYRVSDGYVNHRTGYTDGTSAFNYGAATNKDGTQSTILAYTTAYVYDAATPRRTIGNVVAAKYSPTADVVYMAQYNSSIINAYDTHTWSVLKSYDFGKTFGMSMGGVRGVPRLAVARDNSMLFATIPNGISAVRMRPAVVGTVHSTFRGLPVGGATVEVWRQKVGVWSLEATTAANEFGSWTYTTDDTSTPVRVRVADPSGINTSQWFGGAAIDSATGLTPARLSAPSADVTLTADSPGAIAGTVRSTFKNRPVAGARVVLYDELEGLSPIATVTAGADGSYAFTGLGSARYRVGFSDPASDNVSAYYANSATLDAADTITFSSPTTTTVNQTLTFVGYRATGTVTSSFRGVPVSGATIELWRDNGHGYTLDSTVTAGADGSWRYDTDTSATVHVRAIDPSGAADPTWFGGSTLESATAVNPQRDGTVPTVPIVMTLAHPGAIAGTVRSSSHGQVLAGIRVDLYQDIAGYPTLATTQTASDGTFSFGGLGVTGYRVGFSDETMAHVASFWNGKSTLAGADVVRVTGPLTTTADTTMTFVPTYVGGTVVSSFVSKPIAGAQIELWRNHGAGWALDQTVIANAAGSWSASFETSDAVRLHITDPLGAHDSLWYGGSGIGDATDVMPTRRAPELFTAKMQLTHGATIVGTLRSSWKNEPIAGAVASLFYDDGTGLHSIATTRTAANGSYLFDGLAPATLYVGFTDQTGAHLANLYAASPLFTTIDGLLVNDVTLQRISSVVAGTVVSSFDGPDAENPNPPIAGARVEIYRQGSSGWAREATVTATADGAWSYSALDPSAVRIHVIDPTGMHDPAWYGGNSLAKADDVLPVPNTLETPPTDMTLNLSHPASFHGTVRDAATGARLAGFGVALTSATPEAPLVAWADTAADGSYSITGIPAGNYYLVFVDENDSRYDFQFWTGASTPESATVLAVTGSSDTECNPLMKPVAVTGSFDPIAITNTTAEPVSGQPVHLQTTLFDEWDEPITDATVALQSSTDRLTWATESVPVTTTPDGSLEATVVASEPGVCTYYRYVAFADEFHKPAVSDPIAINPHRSSYLFTETTDAGPDGWNPLVGMDTGIRAKLQTVAGAPLAGKQVHLLSSADGKNFRESGVAVTDAGSGYYEADFSVAGRVWCKLAWNSPDGTIYSATALVEPTKSTLGYFDRPGIGSLGTTSKAVSGGTAVVLTANLRTHASSLTPGTAYVQATGDGLTWVNLPLGQLPFAQVLPPQAPGQGTIWTTFAGASANTTLRLAWVARDWSDAAASSPLNYQTWVFARMPTMSSRQKANRAFVARGYSDSGTGIKLVVLRKTGSVYKPCVSATIKRPAGTSGTFAYRATLKLKAGSYRVYTIALADATHIQSPPSSQWPFVCK